MPTGLLGRLLSQHPALQPVTPKVHLHGRYSRALVFLHHILGLASESCTNLGVAEKCCVCSAPAQGPGPLPGMLPVGPAGPALSRGAPSTPWGGTRGLHQQP